MRQNQAFWAFHPYQKSGLWDITEPDDEKAAVSGIDKMAEFFESLEMPTHLSDFGIPSNCTVRLADLCTFGRQRTVPNYIDLDYDKIKDIFDMCM